jgi:hypothetical protein
MNVLPEAKCDVPEQNLSNIEKFQMELENLINSHSIEKELDIPDFILAKMICDMLRAIGPNIKKTLDWHGCDSVCHPLNINN